MPSMTLKEGRMIRDFWKEFPNSLKDETWVAKDDYAIMDHCLHGARRSGWNERNYYAQNIKSDEIPRLEELVKMKLMRRGKNFPCGREELRYYHVRDEIRQHIIPTEYL